jgi:hypothetical protein
MGKRNRRKPSRNDQQAALPGEIRYRPPTGKPSDRLLNQLKVKSSDTNQYQPPKLTAALD